MGFLIQLTPAFLSRHRNVLTGLASLTREYLPNVADPVETLRAVAGSDAQQETDKVSEADLIASIKSAPAGKYIFVALSSAAEGESVEDMLTRHDRLILKVSQAVKAEQKKALFVYTGEPSLDRSARAAPAPITTETGSHGDNKETKQAAVPLNKTYTYFIEPKVIILFEEISLNNERININNITVTEVDQHHIHVELVATPTTDNIAFNITGNGGYWNVDQLVFRDQVLYPIEFVIAALDGFSWHCSPSLILQKTDGTISPLQFTGLQLEPFFVPPQGNGSRSFSDAWDCVGFTSAGIWGGLFVVLLMLSILAVGMSWIMDIRTMDRFDDPKGKTIIVSTTD